MLVVQMAAKESEALIGTESIASCLALSVVVSRIAPSDSIANIGLTSPCHGVFTHF